MKTLNMLVLAVAITFSSVLTASTKPIKNAEPKTISNTIGDLLKHPNFKLIHDIRTTANIIITSSNEMVVLSVDTDNETVEQFIKSRLNYKKLSEETIGTRKSFTIPIRLLGSE